MTKCTFAEAMMANRRAMQERDDRREAERLAAKVVDLKKEKVRRRYLRARASMAARMEREWNELWGRLSPEARAELLSTETEPEPSEAEVSPDASCKPKPAPEEP